MGESIQKQLFEEIEKVTRAELLKRLQEAKVDPATYSLDGGLPKGAYVLSNESFGMWAIYRSERGARQDEMKFKSESEACEELFRWIMADPSTRRAPGSQ